jgi:hypothetical protein
MECKRKDWVGKLYGVTAVRFGNWNHTVGRMLDKTGYACLDPTMMEFIMYSL